MPDEFNIYLVSILNDIKRIGDSLIKIQEAVMQLTLAVESLKTTEKIRSAIYGATGGVVATTLIILTVRAIWGGLMIK